MEALIHISKEIHRGQEICERIKARETVKPVL
jgi:hypothetical protein